jgi:hypothetical protein
MLQNYLACGNPEDAIDFYGLNAYEWCGDATYQTSGYEFLQQNASDYNIPIFFSETGCNTPMPRTFGDQSAILGSEMDGTWSGAIIYEWIQEANGYGLVSYGPSAAATATATNVVAGFTRGGSPTPISPDWQNLSQQWATLNPTGVQEAAYTPSLSPPACPAYTSGAWLVNPDTPLPTVGQAVVQSSGDSSSATTGSSGSSGATSTGKSSSGASSTRASGSGSSSGSAAASSGTSSGAAAASSGGAARAVGFASGEMPWVVMGAVTVLCSSLGIFLL